MDRTSRLCEMKIIMIGTDSVGKSCLMHRYIEGKFPMRIYSTIGTDFRDRVLEMEPGMRVKVVVWDTQGIERAWSSIVPFIRGSAGCLLVFDVGDEDSFRYIRIRHQQVSELMHPNIVIFVIVGNKSDQNKRAVSQEEAERLADELGVQYIETSAVTGQNVEEAFRLVTWPIYQAILCGEVKMQGVKGSKRSITPKNSAKNKCCAF